MEQEQGNRSVDERVAFPTLTAEQLRRLEGYGDVRETGAGEVLFEEGDAAYDFFVILEGEAEVVDRSGDDEKVLATHGRGRFLGELNMFTGQSVYLMGRMKGAGRVLAIPPEHLRLVVAEEPELSDLILKAFIARRVILVEEATTGLQIVGSRFSPETLRLRAAASFRTCGSTWKKTRAPRRSCAASTWPPKKRPSSSGRARRS